MAKAPELPGCAAHGDTQEAALEHIGQAVDLWLETAREVRRPDPGTQGRAPDAGMTTITEADVEAAAMSDHLHGIRPTP